MAEDDLTDREVEILRLIAGGNTNSQMSEQLCISEYTVETHRKNIHHKFKSNNTASMLQRARERKYL